MFITKVIIHTLFLLLPTYEHISSMLTFRAFFSLLNSPAKANTYFRASSTFFLKGASL